MAGQKNVPGTKNAEIISRFKNGGAGVDDVLRVTSAAIKKQCARDWKAAVACVEALQQCQIEPDVVVFNAAISVCGNAGQVDEARKLFNQMPTHGRDSPNIFVYSTMISAYGKAGRPDEAQKLFDQMRDRDIPHGVIIYNAMISARGNAGQVDEARKLFDEMPSRDVFSYSAMISAHGEAGQVDEARELFDEMPRNRIPRNSITYNAMISAHGNAGQVDEARELFDEMPSRDVFSYSTMISTYVNAGKTDEALKLFGEMQSCSISPNIFTYTDLISALDRTEQHDKVAELLQKGIDSEVFKPSLGFNKKLNKLDLHQSAILTKPTGTERDEGVASSVATAIFRRLMEEGSLNVETQIVVGYHGTGALKEAIEQCMRKQGWTPVQPLDSKGQPNPGRLCAAPQPKLGRGGAEQSRSAQRPGQQREMRGGSLPSAKAGQRTMQTPHQQSGSLNSGRTCPRAPQRPDQRRWKVAGPRNVPKLDDSQRHQQPNAQ